MVNGMDVSDFQTNVNWQSVNEAGYSFAYCKATEGLNWTADTFAANWAGLAAAGMLRGAYHLFHFDEDPVLQADHFLKVVQPRSGISRRPSIWSSTFPTVRTPRLPT
jgi:lysozyme